MVRLGAHCGSYCSDYYLVVELRTLKLVEHLQRS